MRIEKSKQDKKSTLLKNPGGLNPRKVKKFRLDKKPR